MLRGSSFLLNYSYTVWEPVVRKILEPQYDTLNGVDFLDARFPKLANVSDYYDLLFGKTSKSSIKGNNIKVDGDEFIIDNYYHVNNVSNGLVHWLKEYLAKVKKLTKDKESVSDILITKILLGTLACVPAYDRFFKNTLKELSIKQNFNKNNLEELIFWCRNTPKFKNTQLNTKVVSGNYLLSFKLLDLMFWYYSI